MIGASGFDDSHLYWRLGQWREGRTALCCKTCDQLHLKVESIVRLGLELAISRLSPEVGLRGRSCEEWPRRCLAAAKMVITARVRLQPPPPLTHQPVLLSFRASTYFKSESYLKCIRVHC